ncbi:MAG: hypothetical protein ACK4H7_05305, partial [Acidilobaceae archaeon]
YIRYIKENKQIETIYKIDCKIFSTLKTDSSWCRPLISDDNSPKLYTYKFTGDVLFSTGFQGRIWLVKYKYVYVDRLGYENVLNDNVIAVWMEPRFNEYGKIVADWEVDDNPNDGLGVTENVLKILRQNITYVYVSKEYGGYALDVEFIYANSGASPRFGVAIPVGALAVTLAGTTNPVIAAIGSIAVQLAIGIEAGAYTGTFYENFGLFVLNLVSDDPVYGLYALFTNTYMVRGEFVERAVPLVV